MAVTGIFNGNIITGCVSRDKPKRVVPVTGLTPRLSESLRSLYA
jgi:hypothetical protein